jgi:hypothetical protein
MSTPADNETWIIEAGDAVIAKRTALGDSALSPTERLIYCVWVADYGMRNAGDLETACDLYPEFQKEAAHLAAELGLGFTHATFSLPAVAMQKEYFERFDRICDEIKNGYSKVAAEAVCG